MNIFDELFSPSILFSANSPSPWWKNNVTHPPSTAALTKKSLEASLKPLRHRWKPSNLFLMQAVPNFLMMGFGGWNRFQSKGCLLPLNKEELVNCEISILYIHMHICIIIDNKMYEYVYSSITCLKEMAHNNFHIWLVCDGTPTTLPFWGWRLSAKILVTQLFGQCCFFDVLTTSPMWSIPWDAIQLFPVSFKFWSLLQYIIDGKETTLTSLQTLSWSLWNLLLEGHLMTCKWLITMVGIRSLSRVVPLPNGLSMAINGGYESLTSWVDLVILYMSSEKNPSWFFDIGGYTTQLCGDYNKPLYGSLLNNHYFMESIWPPGRFFFFVAHMAANL